MNLQSESLEMIFLGDFRLRLRLWIYRERDSKPDSKPTVKQPDSESYESVRFAVATTAKKKNVYHSERALNFVELLLF